MLRPVSIAILALLAGCTASKASLQILNAQQALSRAETQGAVDMAAYEYTMAKLYLSKAQEEVGYSEFRIADALARQSAEWSDRAVIFIEKRGRNEIELADFALPETPNVQPIVDPEPTPAPEAPPPIPVEPDPTLEEDWLQESDPDAIPGGIPIPGGAIPGGSPMPGGTPAYPFSLSSSLGGGNDIF